MTMGDKIRQARIERGYTQEELGKIIGVQKSAVAKYENGRVTNLKRAVINELAKALNVSPAYLIDDDDNTTEVNQMTLGNIIKEYRSEHNLSQRRFAIMAGITNSYVSCLEANENTSSGKVPVPTVTVLEGCARAMGMKLDELIFRLGEEQTTALHIESSTDLENDAREMLFAFRKLNDSGKRTAITLINALSKMPEFESEE